MRLLVTGGAGFIGSAVIRQALGAGHEVLNLDRLTYAANLHNLDPVLPNAAYRFEKIDIRDSEKTEQVFRDFVPEAVLHLAAESHVDRSIDGPDAFITTNVNGTFNLLQAARGVMTSGDSPNLRFIHVSTDEVYGDLDETDPAFTEDHPYQPSSPYSASKAASDHLARAWHRTYGLPVIVTNCSNNYGPYQYPEKLIPVVILNCLAEQPIPVYGEGKNIRDWLYVEDHAQALLRVAEHGAPGQTYNIGGNNERRNIDLVTTLCALMDKARPRAFGSYADLISFVRDRPGHDRRYAINAEKIYRDLGWQPHMQADEGFAKTVNWYLSRQDWWGPLMAEHDLGQRLGAGLAPKPQGSTKRTT